MGEINYDNKVFVSVENTKNGEVNEETIFYYHQKEKFIWAEYNGGKIIKGFLVGYINKNGKLIFCYEHINNEQIIRTGKCESEPVLLSDGRITLNEKWEWTNGDK
jgi:hypothetical protein